MDGRCGRIITKPSTANGQGGCEDIHVTRLGHLGHLAWVAVFLALAYGANAQAATPAQRAYGIAMNTDRETLAVSPQQVHASIVRAQAQLTPCLKTLRPLLFDRTRRMQALSLFIELGEQYAALALKPVLVPLASGYSALLKLPAPAGTLSGLRAHSRLLATVQSLNACDDARRWQQAGFAVWAEPPDTRFAADAHVPAAITVSQVFSFTPAEQRTLAAEHAQGTQHVDALQRLVAVASAAWVKDSLGLA